MAGDEAPSTKEQSPMLSEEKPWLLPYNRKLRHLQGISIRNLTLTLESGRPRGKTIDDEAIPSTLKTPTKALAQRETKIMAHSRSSSDLRSTEETVRRSPADLQSHGSPRKNSRPPPVPRAAPRRRSTLEWTGVDTGERQRKLEHIMTGRMVDTFFSLHVQHDEDPIYISEIAPKAMNPSFRWFDLASCGPGTTRLDKLIVKVWVRNDHMANWQYLIDCVVELRALRFIGRSLEKFRQPLPPNCILFHMTDGVYTSFIDFPPRWKTPLIPDKAAEAKAERQVLPTSSYDALMRLSTLDDCIQDALATRDRIAEEIESILEKNKEAISAVNQVPEAEETLRTVESAIATEKKRVEAVRRRRDELKANIQFRRDCIRKGQELQQRAEEEMATQREELRKKHVVNQTVQEDIAGQRRRICEDLQKVYPIEPIPGKALAFTIRGLALPNAEFDDTKQQDVVAAALGYVAEVVQLLSPYLSVHLPYPVKPQGSASTIEDPLSMTPNAPRMYPLFMKGVVKYRFEYGVFLLNKNIEILANSLGLKLVDIRPTLPNLKYLLFVATAGKGELPARKAGGIRGLLRHGHDMSRTASIDSTASSVTEIKDAAEMGNSPGRGIKVKNNGNPVSAKQALQRAGVPHGSKLREVEQGI